MKRNTSEHDTVQEFLRIVAGTARVKIHRADGTVEGPWELHNQVAAGGLDELATKTIVTSRAAFDYIAVGSGTVAASLGSTALIHEVDRKASITPVTSRSNIILTNTWGGAADGVTSVVLEEAGIFNAAAAGTMLNKLTGVDATLADSDILNLEMTFRIGSHGL